MNYLKYIFPFALLLLGLLACVKEYDLEDTETINPPPKEIITAHVYGRVIDEDNQTVDGAEVILNTHEGSEHVTTDERGYFEFEDARIPGQSAFLEIRHAGKFDAFRRLSALKGQWNYTEVKLLDKEIVGSLNASTGGQVSSSEGAELALPSNAVVRQDGSPYHGNIDVAMAWIDPTAEDLQQRIVGDLSGIDINGNQVALGTYGMMIVELLDNSGNELQIADGQTAQLSYPIPADIHGDPPQTVPMWSYDEDLGTWIEETVASKQDGKYVTEVSHFSAWNVDWKGDIIEISGKVTLDGQTGSMLSSFKILVSSPVFGQRGGYLTPDGQFLFYRFPANEEFTLTIYDICGQVVYEDVYGPYGQDTDLGMIDISGSSIVDLIISGTALDCNNDPIDGALIQIDYDDYKLYTGETEADGSFEIATPYCGSPIDASAILYDVSSGKSSQPQDFTIDGNDIMLGDIEVCDEPPEFVSFTVDNTEDFYVTSPPGFINMTNNNPNQIYRLVYEGQNGFLFVQFDNEVTGTGMYNSSEYLFNTSNAGGGGVPGGYRNTTPPDLTVDITEYSDNPGDFIRGEFGGTVIDSLQNQLPIEGNFKVKVD